MILRALSKSPVDRFATAVEMREALELALAKKKAKSPRVVDPASTEKKRTAAFMLGGAVVLVAAAAAMGWRAGPQAADATNVTSAEVAAHGDVAAKPVAAPVVVRLNAASSASADERTDASVGENAAPNAFVTNTFVATMQAAAADLKEGATKALTVNGVDSESAAIVRPSDDSNGTPTPLAHGDRSHTDHVDHNERERRLWEARAFGKAHLSEPRALRAWATAAYRAGELREARRASELWALRDGSAEPRLFLAKRARCEWASGRGEVRARRVPPAPSRFDRSAADACATGCASPERRNAIASRRPRAFFAARSLIHSKLSIDTSSRACVAIDPIHGGAHIPGVGCSTLASSCLASIPAFAFG